MYVLTLFVAMPAQGSTTHSTWAFEAGADAEQASHNSGVQCMTEKCELSPFMMNACVAVFLICINSQPLSYKLVDSMFGVHFLCLGSI